MVILLCHQKCPQFFPYETNIPKTNPCNQVTPTHTPHVYGIYQSPAVYVGYK